MTTRNGHDFSRNRAQHLTRVRGFITDREPPRSDASVLMDFPPGPRAGADWTPIADNRTRSLVDNGRINAYSPGWSRTRRVLVVTALGLVSVVILAMVLSGRGASWPASVTRMQSLISKACQNPDVRSEPNQVNFACSKNTNAILWVFALMTSGGSASYGDAKTGRLGLEPITPQQGGEVAWSLNLHSPYNPANPIDSLEVAARAINNIIGGATVTGSNGKPIVQPGLESDPSNCLRYTGSSALKSRPGYPSLCAQPVTSPAGQAALVADVYEKWMVGAAPQAAQDAGTLFEYSNDPGASQVQAILRHLPGARQPVSS
jgi:hypothetical protein